MKCKICEIRKPRRYCPGVQGDICSLCCGSEREVTVDCPFDCHYLREARVHEEKPELHTVPNEDIRPSEAFLRRHEKLVIDFLVTVYQAAMRTRGTVDYDVREALDNLIRTWRTRQSGLYYNSRPEDRTAAALYDALRDFLEKAQREASVQSLSIRDSEILELLAFAQRLELRENNGRKRGRAFLDSLRESFAHAMSVESAPPAPSLIVP